MLSPVQKLFVIVIITMSDSKTRNVTESGYKSECCRITDSFHKSKIRQIQLFVSHSNTSFMLVLFDAQFMWTLAIYCLFLHFCEQRPKNYACIQNSFMFFNNSFISQLND